MNRGNWRATVHGVTESRTQQSNEYFTRADKNICIIITAKSVKMLPLKMLALLKKIPVSRRVIIRISSTW